MSTEFYEIHGVRVYEYPEDGPLLSNERHATDAIAAAREHQASLLVLPTERLSNDFFQLKTGVAGTVIQKFVTYGVRLAIVGDISKHLEASNSLRDFVYEANRGRHLWFLANHSELEKKLASSREAR